MSSEQDRPRSWRRDAGQIARQVGGETSNALTQREAWEEVSETLRVLTEVVVAQHELITQLTTRIEHLERTTTNE